MNSTLMNIIAIALNDRGAKTAVGMGLPVEVGKPSEILEGHWNSGKSIVLVMALPIVVRLLAKRELEKSHDPVIVACDEKAQFMIPVLGGHRGANRLAAELASRAGATAVLTTASELSDIPAIDGLSGFAAVGDIAGTIESMLEGNEPRVQSEIEWPAPIRLSGGSGPAVVTISDAVPGVQQPLGVQLIPPSLVLGIGCSSDADESDVRSLVLEALSRNSLDHRAVARVATVDARKSHPAIAALGYPIDSYPASSLDQVAVPSPSEIVEFHMGTGSVAEAAAILGTGMGELVVPKQKNRRATVAIARQRARGTIRLVGLGPGDAMWRTPAAVQAVISSEVVIGYDPYISQCTELLSPNQLVVRSPIGDEIARAQSALSYAIEGRSVALVCSGDPEIYAMASITLEVIESAADANHALPALLPRLEVVPGITAALGGGAMLGAPLGHDHAYLSLSDLLTPWKTIEKRIHAFGEADVTIVVYNPQSRTRIWQLPAALEILKSYRPPSTPVAVVRNAGRTDSSTKIFTLEEFDPVSVDMTSLVVFGSSTTRRFGNFLITPRGYPVK